MYSIQEETIHNLLTVAKELGEAPAHSFHQDVMLSKLANALAALRKEIAPETEKPEPKPEPPANLLSMSRKESQ